MKSYMPKAGETEQKWYIVDAKGLVLGRLATQVATVLNGKHKPTFTRHFNVGDGVIVINADQIVLTGEKLDQKIYHHHSHYPGGMKTETYRSLLKRRPEHIIEIAVLGMLPNNCLRRVRMKKLRIYRSDKHPHQAQKPIPLEIKG